MKTITTSKKQTRTTVERSFFNLVLLNFLNIRKGYYKPQQFALKPPTENETILGSLHHFCKNIFSGTLSRK